jgi:hypothetical protein
VELSRADVVAAGADMERGGMTWLETAQGGLTAAGQQEVAVVVADVIGRRMDDIQAHASGIENLGIE